MPTSRAPSRFTDVARKALPAIVRPKYTYSAAINTSAVRITTMLCADTVMLPIDSAASENAFVREPSAPNITRPRPTIAKCTATDTISSSSVVPSAIGWYTSRYTNGPIGTTIASVSAICASIGSGCAAKLRVTANTASGSST